MQLDDHTVEHVLRAEQSYIVPIYQRKYEWEYETLIEFWEDVAAKACNVLDGENKFDHYMGALILVPVDDTMKIAFTPKIEVVDGQQRLITFQLFLAALREVARSYNQNRFIAEIEHYLYNTPKAKDTDETTKYKIVPTHSDRELFHYIIDLPAAEVDKKVEKKYGKILWDNKRRGKYPEKAYLAYFVFRKRIEKFVKYGPQDSEIFSDKIEENIDIDINFSVEDTSERLDAILKSLLNCLKLVVIKLGKNDNAQVIFETLNSKGQELLAMDLVRNNIFYRAENQKAEVEKLYKNFWDHLDDVWWRDEVPNARPKQSRLDHFLAHLLAAETGQKISIRELYAEYRAFAIPKNKPPRFENIEDELKLLDQYAPIYRTLEGKEECDPAIAWLGQKLRTWKVTTAYPVALQMGQDSVSCEEREKIARLIYSYLVRRELCTLTTKNLNKVFQSIAAEFLENGVSVSTLRSYFTEKTGESTKFPSDYDVRQGILAKNAYKISPPPRLPDILWELERECRSEYSEQTEKPYNLSVEHIMPQTWGNEWPFEDGSIGDSGDKSEKAGSRNSLLDTLGNMSLVTQKLNASLGNKSFADKKKGFAKDTTLTLNKWFAEKDQWTEAEIKERGEHLADLAVKRWGNLDEA